MQVQIFEGFGKIVSRVDEVFTQIVIGVNALGSFVVIVKVIVG